MQLLNQDQIEVLREKSHVTYIDPDEIEEKIDVEEESSRRGILYKKDAESMKSPRQ